MFFSALILGTAAAALFSDQPDESGPYGRTDQIPGGMGDDWEESDVSLGQLLMGGSVEREHTNDPLIAREIAMDHLAEHPDYYTALEKMEAALERDGYGYSSKYPRASFLGSKTARDHGISNYPEAAADRKLSALSDFLGKLPFEITVTSGYRHPNVNAKIPGAAKNSRHMHGDAVDVNVKGMTNKQFAAWMYENRHKYPELDQVIWYFDTNHTHIGIGHKRRAEFLQAYKIKAKAEAAGVKQYRLWKPSGNEGSGTGERPAEEGWFSSWWADDDGAEGTAEAPAEDDDGGSWLTSLLGEPTALHSSRQP